MPRGGSKKGERRGGRKKGTPNKTTTEVKAVLQAVFKGLGGIPAMLEWSQGNRTEFYKLWGKLLPTEIKNADGEPLKVKTVTEVIVRTHAEAAALLPMVNSRNGVA